MTEAGGDGSWTLTARHEGVVVGGARGWTADGVAHLSWLSVSERGLGIGRRLLASVEDLASRSGATQLVMPTGDSVASFLRERGWRDEGDAVVRDL